VRLVLTSRRSVAFDTGSSDFLLQSSACTPNRGCEFPGGKFNSYNSTTYTTDYSQWGIIFETGVGVGVGQAAQPEANGIVGYDVVSVAGLRIERQGVGMIESQSTDLFGNTRIQGIFGMGIDRHGASGPIGTTFWRNLISENKVKQKIFSLYLTPKAVGKAELTLGGTNPAKYVGPINYVQVDSLSTTWSIEFESVKVNGHRTRIRRQRATMDSGTSNLIAPQRAAEEIYARISPNIRMIDPDRQWGAYGIECSEVPQLNATITFSIGGKQYTIPPQELSVGKFPGKPGYCQTLINSIRSPSWLIGASLIKYYYTVWDTGNQRMGWAETAHSPKCQ
jgi:hypothetical protein